MKHKALSRKSARQAFEVSLSPSDFGFHNAIEGDKLYFCDFEYAGWDSAEKLVTDFFAQPRYQIPTKALREFIARAFEHADDEGIYQRCKRLLPIAHMKWALIFLNHFKLSDGARRAFAEVSNLDSDDEVKAQQIEKSRQRLHLVQGLIEEGL